MKTPYASSITPLTMLKSSTSISTSEYYASLSAREICDSLSRLIEDWPRIDAWTRIEWYISSEFVKALINRYPQNFYCTSNWGEWGVSFRHSNWERWHFMNEETKEYLVFEPNYLKDWLLVDENNNDIMQFMDFFHRPYMTRVNLLCKNIHNLATTSYQFHKVRKIRIRMQDVLSNKETTFSHLQEIVAKSPKYLSLVENNTQLRIDLTTYDSQNAVTENFITEIAQSLHLTDTVPHKTITTLNDNIQWIKDKIVQIISRIDTQARSNIGSMKDFNEWTRRAINEALEREIIMKKDQDPEYIVLSEDMKTKEITLNEASLSANYSKYMDEINRLVLLLPNYLQCTIEYAHYQSKHMIGFRDYDDNYQWARLRSPYYINLASFLKGNIHEPFWKIERFREFLQVLTLEGKFDADSLEKFWPPRAGE